MNSQTKNHALITGATSGIGYALATECARGGYPLILVARHQEQLEKTAETLRTSFGIQATSIAEDLSMPGAAQRVIDRITHDSMTVDVLINNAGIGLRGKFAENDLHEEQQLLQLNMIALTELTKLILPSMLAKKSGKILNVASTAAFQAGPLMATYYASKAYVLSFSEALRSELMGSGVTVTVVCPGPTETGFAKQARMQHARLFTGKVMDASIVARRAYAGMQAGKHLVIPGLKNKLEVFGTRFAPRMMAARIAGYVNGVKE